MKGTRILVLALLALVLAGCGASKHANPRRTASSAAATTRRAATTTGTGPGALQAEAQSAATGDIPDNQTFVRYTSPLYTLKYPEGWAQSGTARRLLIRDKNNVIRIVLGPGGLPAPAAVRRQLGAVGSVKIVTPPTRTTLPVGEAIKVVYSTQSAANQVTGKRVTLVVDRYYVARDGKSATVDLGTPQGVDNVDAYRLMIESFRWR